MNPDSNRCLEHSLIFSLQFRVRTAAIAMNATESVQTTSLMSPTILATPLTGIRSNPCATSIGDGLLGHLASPINHIVCFTFWFFGPFWVPMFASGFAAGVRHEHPEKSIRGWFGDFGDSAQHKIQAILAQAILLKWLKKILLLRIRLFRVARFISSSHQVLSAVLMVRKGFRLHEGLARDSGVSLQFNSHSASAEGAPPVPGERKVQRKGKELKTEKKPTVDSRRMCRSPEHRDPHQPASLSRQSSCRPPLRRR